MEVKDNKLLFNITSSSLLVASLIALFLTSFISPIKVYGDSASFSYGNEIYGPFAKEDKVTFTYTRKYLSNNTLTKVCDSMRCYCDAYSVTSPYYTTNLNSSHTIYVNDYFSKVVTIPNTKSYLSYGIKVVVGVYSTASKSYIDQNIFYIKEKIKQSINPLDYREKPFEISNTVFRISGNITESFLFNNITDFVEVDSNNCLRFDELSFVYNYINTIKHGECYLYFKDKNNVYPNLINSSNDVYLPFSLVQNENNISIKLSSLYYDPISLNMYKDEKGNKTNYLYVPRGKVDLIKNYNFNLLFNDVGVNETNFSLSLEDSVNGFFLGKCNSEADYCVVGGIRK